MAGYAEGEDSFLYSSTWAIALTFFVFVAISLLVMESFAHLFRKFGHTALQAAVKRIVEELVVVAFISATLTAGTSSMAKICVPKSAAAAMPLCKSNSTPRSTVPLGLLLANAGSQNCSEGNVPFIPYEGFHQLHIFIFILALVHILYSLLTVGLGMWMVSYWKTWEAKSLLHSDDSIHDVRPAKDTKIVRTCRPIPRSWTHMTSVAYVVAFFRQFFCPISEADYITLRNGFIRSHTSGHFPFDFHKYIQRSLQDDFKYVVGISPFLWLFACLWLLINVGGWETQLWTAFIPFALLLVIGTKLQVIVTKMALRFKSGKILAMAMGVFPNVKPSDDLFWFHKPFITLKCIQFVLFQNALDVSSVLWVTVSFSTDNCIYQRKYLLIVRLIIGLLTQILCGLVTLPSYALVSQMGTNIKRTMLEKGIEDAIEQWHQHTRERDDDHERSSNANYEGYGSDSDDHERSSNANHEGYGCDSEPQSPKHFEMEHEKLN